MKLITEVSAGSIEAWAELIYRGDVNRQGWEQHPWFDLEPAARNSYRDQAIKLLREGEDYLLTLVRTFE